MSWRLIAILPWALCCALASPQLFAQTQEMRVAVLAFRGDERALRRWAETLAYLNRVLPDYRFRALPMNLQQLDEAVEQGAVEFAVTNAGQYVRVGSRHGLSPLATLKSRRHPGRDAVIGSALVVRSDSPFYQLDDLRDGRLGAVSRLAFGGFQIYWGEMERQGVEPQVFFQELRFADFPVDALAFWVRDRQVDAAILPACLLETMADEGLIAREAYRVIDAQTHPDYHCQASTPLYPNWSFAKLRQTPAHVAERVAQALLNLPPDSTPAQTANSLGWTAPVSSYEIHQLYRRLAIHPWQAPWWREAMSWWLRNWQWGVALLALALLGFLHHLWVQLQVQRRTRDLRRMNQEFIQQQRQLEHAQRIAILGEISSDLAHELNQPLAAINSYAEGGMVRLQPQEDPHNLHGLLQRIATQAGRGAQIIERIRDFARPGTLRRQPTDLARLLRDTLGLLDYELQRQHLIPQLHLPGAPLRLAIDPIEIQQLLVNLIRNSLEAIAETRAAGALWITLRPGESPGSAEILIEDNGCGIEGEDVNELFRPYYSTKPDGLGLGMAISRRIVEDHQGQIHLAAREGGGTRVRVTLKEPES